MSSPMVGNLPLALTVLMLDSKMVTTRVLSTKKPDVGLMMAS